MGLMSRRYISATDISVSDKLVEDAQIVKELGSREPYCFSVVVAETSSCLERLPRGGLINPLRLPRFACVFQDWIIIQ